MTIKLGCIADDFTGATDIALLIKQAGYSVIQTIGLPESRDALPEADTVVVALKSRTIEPQLAVKQSLSAYEALAARGMEQCFFKYCSTFDSTPKGNIGPVADSLLEVSGADLAVACPSFPANGRTVYMGHLFVHHELLSDSPMREHPLTPMNDSNLVRVLQAQSQHQVGLVTVQQVQSGRHALCRTLQELIDQRKRLAIVDAFTTEHLDTIGESAVDHPLVTGGSALGASLVRARIRAQGGHASLGEEPVNLPAGGSVVLAGSCSQATLAQIAHAKHRMPAIKLDLTQIAAGEFDPDSVVNWARRHLNAGPVLIYASESGEQRNVTAASLSRPKELESLGARIEAAFAALVPRLVEEGVRRFVVAGGETSGAVTRSLGVKILRIGEEIDPGVPWTVSEGSLPIALALKSGNFGGADFFTKALHIIESHEWRSDVEGTC